MRWIAIFLFICLLQGFSLAQPGDKLGFVKVTLNEAPAMYYNCLPELYEKLLKSRKILQDVSNSPDSSEYSSVKTDSYFFRIQLYIYEYQSFCLKQPADAERGELFLRFWNFYRHQQPKLKQGREEARLLMDRLLYSEWEAASKAGNLAQFLESAENQDWYNARNGNAALASVLDDLYQENDLYRKRKELQAANADLAVFCESVFSNYECGYIDRELEKVNASIAAMELRAEQRRRYEMDQKARMDSIATVIKKADELFENGKLAEALALYEANKQFPEWQNHCWRRIIDITKIQGQEYMNQFYLFDQAGKLRIDPSKTMAAAELQQLKDNRKLISAQLIKSLQQYDSAWHKNEMLQGNPNFQQLLPYRVKDTTRHLYQLVCDSSGIVSINHTLLSQNEYGSLSDSVIRQALPSLFSYLKISDNTVHSYWIPVIYIPKRYKFGESTFCNCDEGRDMLDSYGTRFPCREGGYREPNLPEPVYLDEFYFVITEGHRLGPPRKPEIYRTVEREEIKPIKKIRKMKN